MCAVVSVTQENSGNHHWCINLTDQFSKVSNLLLLWRFRRLFSTVQVSHQQRKAALQQGNSKAAEASHSLTLSKVQFYNQKYDFMNVCTAANGL